MSDITIGYNIWVTILETGQSMMPLLKMLERKPFDQLGERYIVGIMVWYSDSREETDSGQEEHVTHHNY